MLNVENTETTIYRCRPSRISFIKEYLLFFFMMILTFTSLYSTIIARLQKYAILSSVMIVLFYALLMISIILLVRVELKIWSKKYVLTNQKITSSKGIFTEMLTSVPYDKITDMELQQTFFDKLMDTGTIYIDTAGTDEIEMVLEHINRPFIVKQKISELQASFENVEQPIRKRTR